MSALTMQIQTHLYSKRTQSELDAQPVGADAFIRPQTDSRKGCPYGMRKTTQTS